MKGQGGAKLMKPLRSCKPGSGYRRRHWFFIPNLSVHIKELQKGLWFPAIHHSWQLWVSRGQFCPDTCLPVCQCAFWLGLLKCHLLAVLSDLRVGHIFLLPKRQISGGLWAHWLCLCLAQGDQMTIQHVSWSTRVTRNKRQQFWAKVRAENEPYIFDQVSSFQLPGFDLQEVYTGDRIDEISLLANPLAIHHCLEQIAICKAALVACWWCALMICL